MDHRGDEKGMLSTIADRNADAQNGAVSCMCWLPPVATRDQFVGKELQ